MGILVTLLTLDILRKTSRRLHPPKRTSKKKCPLTTAQKKQLSNHKKRFSASHVKFMRKKMCKGVSFNKAHTSALRNKGK